MSAFPRTPFISNLEPDNGQSSLGIVCLEGGGGGGVADREGGLQTERQA